MPRRASDRTPQGVAATLHIYDAPTMTKRGRRAIAAWMREQVRFFEYHHDDLGPSFRARYLYDKGTIRKEQKGRLVKHPMWPG